MDGFWRRVEETFHAALEQVTTDRDVWLSSQSGLDPAILEEVRSLLAADRKHNELSAGAPLFHADPADRQGEERRSGAGARFGPYRTLRLLGSGGMGAVYLAERADGQFEQTVALKVMAPNLAGEEFERSFRTERQLLATLSHPNIARLLDGGMAESGVPYLVMEYVDGQLLDRYCAEQKLPVEGRIGLFLQVCEAVEFAHRNLIIHGDLKPGNILVTKEGAVKLLDFGTAKLLCDPEGLVTQSSALTPRYASPEQLRGERVNTVSDVFSLGVIFYELLTGAWPFGDPKSTSDAVDRVLHGREATAPAQVVSQDAAAERSVTLQRLRRQIEGDLSSILLKMLESEPARRYGSAREVKEDLQRFCEGRPIQARPHTAWYSARRFTVRHWPAVLATGLSFVALSSLTILSLYQSANARAQAARAQRVSQFAKNTFLSASSFWYSPLRGKHDAIQFSDILDNAASRLGAELANDPAAEADLRESVGGTYGLLGEPAKGEAQLLLGLQALRRVPGGAPEIQARTLLTLCNSRNFQGRYADALSACRQAAAACRNIGCDYLGSVLHDSAYMAANVGEPLAEVEGMYRESLRYPRPGAPFHPPIVNTRIGMLRLRQGDLDGGEQILQEAERQLRGKAEPMIEIVPALYARAFACDVRGRYAEAVALMTEAFDLVTRRRAWFMDPDERALQLASYEALAGDRKSLTRLREVEPRLPYTGIAAVDRIRHLLAAGIVEARFGRVTVAEDHLRSALAIQEKEMSRQPDIAVELCVRLMELLRATGREGEARQIADQGLAAAAQAYGSYFEGHPFAVALRTASNAQAVSASGSRAPSPR